MKKIITVSFLALVCCVSFAQPAASYPEGLKVGDTAPDFTLKDAGGKKINLKQKLKSGPIVLVFYRGQWCPFCNRHLGVLNDSLQLIKEKGADLLAISPETQEGIAKTVNKTRAVFPVLHDVNMVVMKSYKVQYSVDEKTVEKYRGYGIDFDKANGTNGANLPVPATYIIGKDGIIKYVFFNTDYRKRPSVKEIIENL